MRDASSEKPQYTLVASLVIIFTTISAVVKLAVFAIAVVISLVISLHVTFISFVISLSFSVNSGWGCCRT